MAASTSADDFRPLYRAAGLSPLHMLQVVTFAFCAAGLWLAWHLQQAPEQALTSAGAKNGWAAALGLLALAAPTGSWLYGRRLAAVILISADGQTLRVRDGNLVAPRWRTLRRADITVPPPIGGDSAGEQSVAPPRLEVAVRGGTDFVVSLGRQRESYRALLQALRG